MKTTFFYLALFFILSGFTPQANADAKAVAGSRFTDSTMNDPAPDFILKDLDGKTVALSDYKGKVLVIDFWATWCVPCHDSFPAAQLVLDKYKNDPDVKFLFLDTREKTENYKEQIRKFLAESHFTFKVILDEKGPDGMQNVTYKKYVMPGIPTKFIIDGKGIIRFKSVGFNPSLSTEAAAKEESDMIEAARTH